ncbi:MAG: tetratricopeptide repeat protein [Proteobacteria bacterium]|nr:tetratricopeptide repeat protein [Pseudomonadota bacterium]
MMKTTQQHTTQIRAEYQSLTAPGNHSITQTGNPPFISAVIGELSQRRVLRTLGAYAVAAFVVLQLLDATGDALLIPQWLQTVIASLTIIGFPVTFLLVWLFQLTPDGIRLQRDGLLSRRQASGLFAFMLVVTAGVGYGLFNFYSAAFEKGNGINSILSRSSAASTADEASIAVLPFADMSPNKDQGFIADGIAEEVLNLLAQIDGLKVAARTSSFALRDGQQNIQEIGRLLNVSKVLEGSVRREGDRIRLTAQLINVADGFHIWSKTYDREITDIFALQDEIAESITNELVASIDDVNKPLLRFGRTDSLEAWESYQTGRRYWWKRGVDDLQKAAELFTQAIEQDPEFAAAYAGLADSWLLLNSYGNLSREEALDRSQSLIKKSIELDPLSAEGFAALGLARWKLGELDSAESALRRAIKLDGNYIPAQLWLAGLMGEQQRLQEELLVLEPAIKLDPLNELLVINYVGTMVGTGDFEGGLNKALELLQVKPTSIPLLRTLSGLMYKRGRLAESYEYSQQALALSPEDPMALIMAAEVSMLIGNLEQSRSLLLTLSRVAPNNEKFDSLKMLQMLVDEQFEQLAEWLGPGDLDSSEKLPMPELSKTIWRGWIGLNQDENRVALDNFLRVSERLDEINNDSLRAEIFSMRAVAEQRLDLSEEMNSSLSQARAAVRRMQVVGLKGSQIHYLLSAIESLSGNTEQAIAQFRQAVDGGFSDILTIRYDARLDALRNLPEFANIVQVMQQRVSNAKLEINARQITSL